MSIRLSRRHACLLLVALPATLRAQTAADPQAAAPVRALLAAMAAGDAAAIRAAFAPGAQQAYGDGPAKGGAEFAAWLDSDIIAAAGKVDDPVLEIRGDTVVVTGVFHNNTGYRRAANFLFRTDPQGITFWQMRY